MTDCIIWTGRKWAQGRYGMDSYDGKAMGAHRVAWTKANGKISKGLLVCHKCDNGLCVNVDHLFLGTAKENMRDCIQKGRFKYTLGNQKGQFNNNAKPNLESRYKSIKKRRDEGASYSQLRNEFSLKSNGHLRQILLHKF